MKSQIPVWNDEDEKLYQELSFRRFLYEQYQNKLKREIWDANMKKSSINNRWINLLNKVS